MCVYTYMYREREIHTYTHTTGSYCYYSSILCIYVYMCIYIYVQTKVYGELRIIFIAVKVYGELRRFAEAAIFPCKIANEGAPNRGALKIHLKALLITFGFFPNTIGFRYQRVER